MLWVGAVALVVLLSLLVPASGGEHTDARSLSLSVVAVWGGLGRWRFGGTHRPLQGRRWLVLGPGRSSSSACGRPNAERGDLIAIVTASAPRG